jgi:hypothetical protein
MLSFPRPDDKALAVSRQERGRLLPLLLRRSTILPAAATGGGGWFLCELVAFVSFATVVAAAAVTTLFLPLPDFFPDLFNCGGGLGLTGGQGEDKLAVCCWLFELLLHVAAPPPDG